MKISIKKLLITSAFVFLAAFTQSLFANTTNVIVGFNGALRFSPTNVLIASGDSVVWQWMGSNHSTTSGTNGNHADDNGVPSGSWDSGVNSSGFFFTNTFTNLSASVEIFSYYCSVHHSFGMTGQVFVASSVLPLPPSIAITNPLSGAVFAAPASVTIQAGATNGSGTVTNVQFLVGGAVLANVTAPPFSAVANSLAAGSYTLTAIASDNSDLSATNSVAISVVTPVPVSLGRVFRLSGRNFQFTYSASTGLDYVIQRSANLLSWIPIATNLATSNPMVFMDPSASNSPDFYRVGLLPNP